MIPQKRASIVPQNQPKTKVIQNTPNVHTACK